MAKLTPHLDQQAVWERTVTDYAKIRTPFRDKQQHQNLGHVANFGFCDGTVRFLRYEADAVLPALMTHAGGEVTSVD